MWDDSINQLNIFCAERKVSYCISVLAFAIGIYSLGIEKICQKARYRKKFKIGVWPFRVQANANPNKKEKK
jgi:hypothetical protein